jgi:hypothetical protein
MTKGRQFSMSDMKGTQNMDVVKRVNECPVPVELLEGALRAFAELPDEDRDFEGRILAVFRLMDELEIPDGMENRGDLSMSIAFRLEALAHLRDSPAYRAWSMRTLNEDMDLIHRDLLAVAAVEPVIGGENQRSLRFDENRFFEHVLKISDADGRTHH